MVSRLRRLLFLAAACFAAGLTVPSLAADTLSPAQKAEVEQIIRDYLLNNPELLVEVGQELARRQQEQELLAQQEGIRQHRDAIFAAAHDFVLNPEGSVPVVEFFDYQCGYCKRMHPTITKLNQSQGDVRFIFKEFPILGDVSTFASKAAIASRAQGKYVPFHNALMELRGKLDEAAVMSLAKQVGLDVERLTRDMQAPGVQAAIEANRALAEALNIRGTPTLIIGETLIPGAVDYDRLTAVIDETRKSCQVC